LALALTAACGGGSVPGGGTPVTVATTQGTNIEFRSEPDPPRSGDNAYRITVKRADGTPVTDAAVTAVFSMPPMPSMNMPEMRTDASLTHVGDGTYRGTGQLEMAGTWNVVVSVTRGSEPPDTARFSIVAK
jgi:hypothetical protein